MLPSEYEALVAALKLTSTPVAEYGWNPRPAGAHYVVQLDMESGQLTAGGEKRDRSWEGSLDLFWPKLTDRNEMTEEAEEILTEIFGASWYLNSLQYENASGLFHAEWVFQAMDTPEEPEQEEQDAVPDEG